MIMLWATLNASQQVEAILMSTHNMCFYRELDKIQGQLFEAYYIKIACRDIGNYVDYCT